MKYVSNQAMEQIIRELNQWKNLFCFLAYKLKLDKFPDDELAQYRKDIQETRMNINKETGEINFEYIERKLVVEK